MSRTYATLPFHVAARRFGYEDHDHSSGTCTLWMDAAQKLPYGHAQRCKKRPVFEVTCEHRGPVCLTTTVRFTDGTSAAPLSGCSREGEVAALADYPSTARWSHVRRVVFDSPAAACACDTLLDPRKQNCFYRLERWHTPVAPAGAEAAGGASRPAASGPSAAPRRFACAHWLDPSTGMRCWDGDPGRVYRFRLGWRAGPEG